MRIHLSCVLVMGLLACTTARTSAPEGAAHAESSSPPAALPFIADDYPRALAEAKARGIPLFADAWAPWCHTCRSMRAYIFTDKALARHAGRFVWLEINTDVPGNARFVDQYPIESWPTFFIIDPREEKALVRFAGSATVPQLEKLFEDGERAYRGEATGAAEKLLAQGDELYGEGLPVEAAEAFSMALAEAPPGWSRRGRALESLVMALLGANEYEACARQALEELSKVPRSASAVSATTLGLLCAMRLPKELPAAARLRGALEAKGREALAPPPIEMPADDRSSLYEVLVEAREVAGDEAGARALAAEWLAFLEGEAARAPNPQARTVFDSHRMMAALLLGEPQRVIPAIEQSERDLPGDYNPPARLANLYLEQGRLDDALAASDRALAKVQGSRRLRVLSDRADILVARGDKTAAVKALQDALTHADTLTEAQAPRRERAVIEEKLAALQAQP